MTEFRNMSPALKQSLPMIYASVAKPGTQFGALSLEQFGALVDGSPQILQSFESFVAEQLPPPPPPPPKGPPSGKRVKVALVVPGNIFFFVAARVETPWV